MANQPEDSCETEPHTPEVTGISLSLRITALRRDRVRLWVVSFEATTHEMKTGQRELMHVNVITQLEKQDVEQNHLASRTGVYFHCPDTKQTLSLNRCILFLYKRELFICKAYKCIASRHSVRTYEYAHVSMAARPEAHVAPSRGVQSPEAATCSGLTYLIFVPNTAYCCMLLLHLMNPVFSIFLLY